jgi:hypothetical protein
MHMTSDRKESLFWCTVIAIAVLVLAFSLYAAYSEDAKDKEFGVWCRKAACSGKEVVVCDRVRAVAICKDSSGKHEVLFR